MSSTFKKAITSLVAVSTVMMSSVMGVFSFAASASAASLMSGDLIKASGPAVYYYAQDGKRYVFPNEKTYFSWFQDFSTVKTITDSELANISIGGNMTIRAGTKLVKITTDPKVYAVTPGGVLHWIESEAIAKALFGDNWAMRVVDVPDAFFVNYTGGSSLSTQGHPDGQLVQYAGDSNWYIIWNGQKRKFSSDAALMANGLNKADAVMTTISYPMGADVTGRESAIADAVVTSGPVVGGAISVSLASDTPAGMTLTKNASSVSLAKYTFTAGSAAVTITGLTLHRVGIGAATDLANVYLYDAMGHRLTNGRTVNSTAHTATFSALNLMVPAGGSVSVLVYGDFSASLSGGQHSFEIVDPASVVVTGSATVSGSFPVRGNVFTVGASNSGRLDVTKGTTPANPTVGSSDAEIANFKLTANTNDITVSSVTLYQAGSITNSDLTNLALFQGATKVASADSVGADGRIVLNFTTPYLITNGTTKTFSLHAKVAGRADRTIVTYVEYTTDVHAMDSVYKTGAAICIAPTAVGGCTGAAQGSYDGSGDAYKTSITTQGGTFTNAFNGPVTQNIAKGQLGVPLYKFALTSSDNDLEVRNVRFTVGQASGAANCYVVGSGTTKYFRNLKLVNLDTNQVWMGPTEITSANTPAPTSSAIVFTDSQVISTGKTMNLALVADLSNSEDITNSGEFFSSGTCAYRAVMAPFQLNDIRDVKTGEALALAKVIPNNSQSGNPQTVKSSNLTVALAGSPSSGTVVKKQQNAAAAGFVFSAGQQSDVTVNSVTLTCQADIVGAADYVLGACDDRITALSLWNGDTQVGVAKAPDSNGVAQISNMNLKIVKGTSISLIAKMSLTSSASTTSPYDRVSVGIAAAADIQAQDQDSNSITATVPAAVMNNGNSDSPSVVQTIVNSGTLTVSTDSHPPATVVIASASKDVWVPFAQYKATASYEDVLIDRVAVFASSTLGSAAADNADFKMIAIASNGALKGSDILSSGATGTKDIDLSASPITVPKNGSVSFQVWAKLADLQPSSTVGGLSSGVARSGHAPALGVATSIQTGEWDAAYATKMNIRATGAASGERVYAATGASQGNSMVLRKGKPIVTKQSLSSTTLATIPMDLYKFQVAADTNSIALKQVVFNLSKTANVVLSNVGIRLGSTNIPSTDYQATYVSSTSQVNGTANAKTGSIAANQTDGYLVISFTTEQTVSVGEPKVFTVFATVSANAGSLSSQNVILSFNRDSTNTVRTGYLTNSNNDFASSANVYNIDTSVGGSGAFAATGTFLWSDNSENPHNPTRADDVTAPGSRDWTNDVYVEDLSQTQILNSV